MGLLTKLGFRQRDAAAELAALAKREAQGKLADDDIEKLVDALGKSGKTEGDYQQMLALHKRALELEAAAENLIGAETTVGKAAQAVETYKRKTETILEERKSQLSTLRQKHVDLEAKRKECQKAHCKLEMMRFENPTLFGLDPFNLDEFTLTSGAGQNVLNLADPAAPKLEVPARVWDREARRRAAIHQTATNRALSEHRTKAEAWASGKSRDYSGYVVSDEAFPTFKPPTWAEIIKRGWNNSLALVA